MRIPNTAEVLIFFAAIGQFSDLPSADSELSLAPADADYADSEFSLIPAGADGGAELEYSLAPRCARSYTVRPGDVCSTIGAENRAPTFQIMCQNDQINGRCSNLAASIGRNICLGRDGEDCSDIGIVKVPGDAESIAKQFDVPVEVFKDNNYCYYGGPEKLCPKYHVGSVVCTAKTRVRGPGKSAKCGKIF